MTFTFAGRRIELSYGSIAMAAFLLSLTIAGGASRSDVWGQVYARAVSWTLLLLIVLFVPSATIGQARGRPVLYLLAGALALILLQLIPLPPALWTHLPGREIVAGAPLDMQWRPLAIVPGAAINAAYSMVVPFVAYLLAAGLRQWEDGRLVGMLLFAVFLSTLVGLVQLAGFSLSNPLVNGDGLASGTFANRNHFALFLACGCLLAPVWAFYDRPRIGWRAFAALALIPLFFLMILASGSRAGLLVGVLGFGGGLLVVAADVRIALRRYPRWIMPALTVGFLALTGALILLSLGEDRAFSISRLMTMQIDDDMRKRALPTVMTMIRTYFPCGAGFGGFDTLFRVFEPDGLLKGTYFNRAHDDFLEIILDGGLPAALLLVAAMSWWLWASIRAWRVRSSDMIAKLGSLIILLVAIASVFDYPVRTPLVMAMLVIAGVWLSDPRIDRRHPPLPGRS